MMSLGSVTAPSWTYGAIALGLYLCLILRPWIPQPNFPMVGLRSNFELELVSNFRFYKNAEAILLEGYRKVKAPSLIVVIKS